MAKGKKRNLNDGFTPDEEKIVSEFFAGKSIRTISEESNMGRTAIKNLLEAYKKVHPELKEEIDGKLFKNKNHKEKGDEAPKELSPEDVIKIYNQIMEGETTLTKSSLSIGRNREYIKNRIYEYLKDDEEKIKEFDDKLKQNQSYMSDNEELEMFLELTEEEKKEIIFEKIHSRREKLGRFPYNDSFLERKYNRLRKYFLEDRNAKLREMSCTELTEMNFWSMLYDAPALLGYSLSDKIKPAMRNLDKNEHIGPENATKIVVGEASILVSSISRTNLQIQMIVDNGVLGLFLKKPKCFRTSPEVIYSLVKYAEISGIDKEHIFLTDKRLKSRYGVTTEQLTKSYDAKKEYGDYEYFDK